MSEQHDAVSHLTGEVLTTDDKATLGHAAHIEEQTTSPPLDNGVQEVSCQVLVVGMGFSGITAMHRLRKAGVDVKAFESGADFGGVWYWNRYPGARVDSEMPFYQLNIPEVYRDFNFSERFPGHAELRRYMAHIDKVLQLRKDTFFGARVNSCTWDEVSSTWTVKTEAGHMARCKYLIATSGLLHRTYTPDFPGLQKYKGPVYHSGAWDENFSAKGKKVALIGAGATAVQITQEVGKAADELTVFLRRPSYCVPMYQRPLTDVEQDQAKIYLPAVFAAGRHSFSGFPGTPSGKNTLDATASQRQEHWERNWRGGGFQWALAQYADVGVDPAANRLAYDFWRSKVCARLTDPEKQRIMAPEKAPYYMGTKRTPLEQDYYEVLNQPNVKIHDLQAAPLREFVEQGIVTEDGKVHEVDAVLLATGFDSNTGSLMHMGIQGRDGVRLQDFWREKGTTTYFGLNVPGFPNLFFSYGPQTPVALSNGVTIIEAQVEMIVDMIRRLEEEGAQAIDARPEAAAAYKQELDAVAQYSLIRTTDSWWNGANIPGKKAETFIYLKGIETYEKECRATIPEWKGWNVVRAAA